MKEQNKLLTGCKYELMADPKTMFYTAILFSLKTKWDKQIKTAAVDGYTLFINPDYFDQLTVDIRLLTILHEVLHIALNHITRMGKRTVTCSISGESYSLWNIAGDYVINLMLYEIGHNIPKTWLLDRKFKGMSTEQVYDHLFGTLDPTCSKLPGTPPDMVLPDDIKVPPTETDKIQTEQDITSMILQATELTKHEAGYSSVPGEVQRVLDATTNPKLPWNVIFQNLLFAYARDDYTWSRPNRRYTPAMYLPSSYSEGMGKFALAVDSSGSVSPEEFNYFIAETCIIQETLKPELISVISFDTKLSEIQEVIEGTNILEDLEFHGGGGTDIDPVLEWARENEPEIMVIFTDGDFHIPRNKGKYPSCPIIWLIHNNPNFNAPVGDIVHYTL